MIHPFKVKPPGRITEEHIKLLKEWASVCKTTWTKKSPSAKVWNMIRESFKKGAFNDSGLASIRDAVLTYDCYCRRFKPLVQLWEMGLVPVFDGKKWKLHAGKNAEVIFEIDKKKLEAECSTTS